MGPIEWLEHRIPPPLVMLSTALLMWLLDGALPGWRWSLDGSVWGWGIALCGVAIDAYCFAGFVRHKTTVNPLQPENASAIVSTGLYRFSRNPMYLGMAIVLLGWTVVLGNPVCFFGLPLFMGYIQRFQIIPEENALARRFGEEYLAYARRVRRWL